MATINMPKKDKDADDGLPETASQRRPKQERYLLQVDRQTKFSYATLEEAEKVGRAIKKDHPVVKVSVYDTVQSGSTDVQ
jgi:hypothetical protein